MSRPIPKSGGRFPGGGGQQWKGKRARPDGGWRERAPVVKWSHAEAMKKKPKVGGEAAVAGDGGGWSREVEEAEKEGLDGRSCGIGGFGMSWSEVSMKKAHTATGVGENEWCLPEEERTKASPCDGVKGGGGGEVGVDADEEEMYGWRWSEAVSPEILALVLRGRLAADDIARGAVAVCRAWRDATAAPDMWGDVDIEAWCRRVNCRVRADAAVRRLVARAQGTLRRLSAYRVGDASLAYVATS